MAEYMLGTSPHRELVERGLSNRYSSVNDGDRSKLLLNSVAAGFEDTNPDSTTNCGINGNISNGLKNKLYRLQSGPQLFNQMHSPTSNDLTSTIIPLINSGGQSKQPGITSLLIRCWMRLTCISLPAWLIFKINLLACLLLGRWFLPLTTMCLVIGRSTPFKTALLFLSLKTTSQQASITYVCQDLIYETHHTPTDSGQLLISGGRGLEPLVRLVSLGLLMDNTATPASNQTNSSGLFTSAQPSSTVFKPRLHTWFNSISGFSQFVAAGDHQIFEKSRENIEKIIVLSNNNLDKLLDKSYCNLTKTIEQSNDNLRKSLAHSENLMSKLFETTFLKIESLSNSFELALTAFIKTWLTPNDLDNLFLPLGFGFVRKDRGTRGGSVAFIIKDTVFYIVVSVPSMCFHNEIVSIDVPTSTINCRFISYYRSGGFDVSAKQYAFDSVRCMKKLCRVYREDLQSLSRLYIISYTCLDCMQLECILWNVGAPPDPELFSFEHVPTQTANSKPLQGVKLPTSSTEWTEANAYF
ncbi:hypothetical protein HELRODRAFT_176179 [Helobdella robusta]|uniref:Uncharacterized protein n=1 Tax=Helobdella robusta TaxID=6412 RepID=T1FA93_HELRO|nr:hypothetical protein HELRODRAFT_176179 [Helobdella robusta]ESO00310.1 hypothetical protein HELRODRAFT_176179 [Helobdella robusta]